MSRNAYALRRIWARMPSDLLPLVLRVLCVLLAGLALAEAQQRVGDELVDTAFHRVQLLEAANLVPDQWMSDTCAFQSSDTTGRS